jgi:hypothetical protein
MTSYFLAATGQRHGSDARARWTVVACTCGLCGDGQHVAVDEPLDTSVGYEDQTEEWRRNAKRHIAIGNLSIVGQPERVADRADALDR